MHWNNICGYKNSLLTMDESDIIASVRSIRKLVVTLDSLGLPITALLSDEELSKEIPTDLSSRIKEVASDVHSLLQSIEKNKRYKEAVKHLCKVEEIP